MINNYLMEQEQHPVIVPLNLVGFSVWIKDTYSILNIKVLYTLTITLYIK